MERAGPQATAAIERLLDLIERDDTAPTTGRERAEALDVHIADSLSGLELPAARVSLVESVGRRCAFLERAIAAMGLSNTRVVNARAEAWPDGLGAHDLVTARALASLNVLVEYAAPLLAERGALVAWKGRRDAAEEADGAAAAAALGMEPRSVTRVQPFPDARERHLHLYLKVGPTPNDYPRRPGMARKRPLRAST